MKVAELLDAPRAYSAPDGDKKPKATKAEVALMHINTAWKTGALRTSIPTAVVKVLANTMMSIARQSGETVFDPRRVLRWAHRRKINLADKTIVEITQREFDRRFFFNMDERGELLNVTIDDRLNHKLWMIAATGETASQRHVARTLREDARRESDRLRKEEIRRAAGKPTIEERRKDSNQSLSVIYGVSRTTIRKWKQSGKLNVAGGPLAARL